MGSIVEELPTPDGGRILVYDDGSRQWVRGATIVYSEGPMSRERGVETTDRGTSGRGLPAPDPAPGRRAIGARSSLSEAIDATRPRGDVDPADPGDMEWLRQQIMQGLGYIESRPLVSVPGDEYLFVLTQHDGWGYLIGRRHHVMVASRIIGGLGGTPVYDGARYLWGVRGSDAARMAWRRDYTRAHPVLSGLTGDDTATALADTGVPPASASPFGGMDPREIPAAIMGISRAAMEADAQIATAFERFVAQYNGDGLAGSIVAILAGVVEFVVRFVVGLVGLPAALGTLVEEFGGILEALRQALPDLLVSLREAPGATLLELSQMAMQAIAELTGASAIVESAASAGETAVDGRSAESSLHIIRVTTRILEMLMIVRGLVTGVQRLPAMAARMRGRIARMREMATRLRALRSTLRAGGVAAIEESDDVARGARRAGAVAESEAAAGEGVEGRRRRPREGEGATDDAGTAGHAEPDEVGTAAASEAEAEAGALDEAAEAAPDATGPTLPPGFHAYYEAMERLIIAAQEGGVIDAADLQRSRAFRQVIERLRRGGHLPDGMARPFLEFQTRLDVIEAVAHNREAAAAAARVLAAGGTPATAGIGSAGEELARRILVRRGYRNVMAVINRSNNGVDLIGINRAGMVRVFEIKASAGARAPALSAPQRSAREFALSRLRLIEARRGPYATATETMRATARTLLTQLDRQRYVGGAIFEVTHALSAPRVRVRAWRGTVPPRTGRWWAALFRRMGLTDS